MLMALERSDASETSRRLGLPSLSRRAGIPELDDVRRTSDEPARHMLAMTEHDQRKLARHLRQPPSRPTIKTSAMLLCRACFTYSMRAWSAAFDHGRSAAL